MASLEPYLFFIPFMLIQLIPFIVAQQPNFIGHYCLSSESSEGSGNYPNNSTNAANLNSLLTSFSTTTVDYGFYYSSAGNNSSDRVNAVGLCRPDISPEGCRSCMNTSSHAIREKCPNSMEAVLYYDTCMLRYSNRSIFGIWENNYGLYADASGRNFSDVKQAYQVLSNFLGDMRKEAARRGPNRKYAAGEVVVNGSDTLYGLTQCTPDFQETQCIDCINELISLIPSSVGATKRGRLFGTSCNLRYDTNRFYGPLPDDDASSTFPTPQPSNGRHDKGTYLYLKLRALNITRVLKIIWEQYLSKLWI